MNEPDRVREAYRHCEALVRTHDKDNFLGALFAPAGRRPFLFALYAFAFEIARVKATVHEPMAGMIRLQWWIEAIAGLRGEEAAASPVMIALADAARQTNVPLTPLTAAIEARQAELEGAPTSNALAPIFAMAARVLGGEGEAINAEADLAAQAVTFVSTDPAKAREAYRAFRVKLSDLPEQALPAFISVALVPLLLRKLRAPPWRRQLALLRAAWLGFPKT